MKNKRKLFLFIFVLIIIVLGILIYNSKLLRKETKKVTPATDLSEIIQNLSAPKNETFEEVPKKIFESLSASQNEKLESVSNDVIKSLSAPSR